MAASDNICQLELTEDKDAPLFELLQSNIRVLVLGGPLVGKTTLISACVNTGLNIEDKSACTVSFKTNKSTVTEFKGLHSENKHRGEVWKATAEFVSHTNIDIVWFCTNTDFLDNNDELWHWVDALDKVCHVVIVRTKCLSPTEELHAAASKILSNPPPVVCVLSKDMQLNPKGGGAIVDGYGVDDLINVTAEQVKNRKSVTRGAMDKLLNQVKSDELRYTTEEQQKGLMVNALRSLSSTEGTEISLREEEFVLIPRPESPSTGFVHMIKSKPARTAIGALVAFAVFLLVLL